MRMATVEHQLVRLGAVRLAAWGMTLMVLSDQRCSAMNSGGTWKLLELKPL